MTWNYPHWLNIKWNSFFQQNAASIKRVMSKGVATNPAGLKKATKERTAVLCKSHDHMRAKFGKNRKLSLLKQQPNALAKLICATE